MSSQHEIHWSLIAQFSGKASEVCSLMSLNRKSRKILLESEQVDLEIFQPIAEELLVEKLGGNKEELLEHSPTKSWYEILVEFYQFPFKFSLENGVDLINHDEYLHYKNCGGVTMIYMYEPCELMEIVLKKVNESKMIEFHKILFALSVLQQEDDPNLAQLSVKLRFNEEKTSISYGKLFLLMLNMNENVKYFDIFNSYQEEIRFDMFPKFKPHKIKLNPSNDIFKLCENPPYGITDKNSLNLAKIRNDIYGDYKTLESFDWESHLETSWSTLWQAGQEWWGTYAHSSYFPIRNVFIIAFASTSD